MIVKTEALMRQWYTTDDVSLTSPSGRQHIPVYAFTLTLLHKDSSVLTMPVCCPVHQDHGAVSLYQGGNRVIGFVGLLCGRSHVTTSWVLNVSITGHDKLS